MGDIPTSTSATLTMKILGMKMHVELKEKMAIQKKNFAYQNDIKNQRIQNNF